MMQGNRWVRKPKSTTSAVFVHGILSSEKTGWRHENGCYWPNLLRDQPGLESLGIYVFTYQTGLFSGSYRLSDIVDALKEYLRLDGVLNSKQLVFVCHSMGGIVVRKFLVERAVDLIEGEKEIGLFLIASPSLGSSYADWLSPLIHILGNAQAEVLGLAESNPWLEDLDKEFTNLKEAGKLRIKGKELVEDKSIVLKTVWRTQVVKPFSGAKYFGEPFKVPGSDHFSIATPKDEGEIQHLQLCEFITKMKEFSPPPHTRKAETSAAVLGESPHTTPLQPQRLALENGSRYLDRFSIIGAMSRGGFSESYLARDISHDRQVIIKIFLIDEKAPHLQKLLAREVLMAKRIPRGIPGLVNTLEVIQIQGGYCFVQEPIYGESLHNRIVAQTMLNVSEAITTTAKLCEHLANLHGKRIVHCDIKPMNIIIDSSGSPIIIDLGTARFFEEKIEAEEVVLSMPYSPNELLSGDPIDGRVDIYSLGMTLLHMLAGLDMLYKDDDYWSEFMKCDPGSMPRPVDVSKHPTSAQLKLYIEDRLKQVSPPSLKSVIKKALSQNPSDRYCDANEFRLAMIECKKDV